MALALALLLAGQPLSPAIIVVDESCSLADAIESANTDAPVGACTVGSGADEIRLTAKINLTEPLPAIDSPVTLEGNGYTIRRDESAADFGVLELQGSSNVALRNVTLSNGRADKGGGLYNNTQNLTLVNTTLADNEATSRGGGLYNGWDTFTVTLLYSTVADNYAGSDGGGVFGAYSGDLTIKSSTISNNVAADDAGGVMVYYYSDVTLENSTVSGNTAGDKGGALYMDYASGLTLVNSTVTGNAAATDGGIYYDNFGSFFLSLSGTIVAGNANGNCTGDGLTDNGGNFDDDGSCGLVPIVPGADFDLALANNGGPTRTHALLAGSVADDAAGVCGLAGDQRDFPRDVVCDSGSVELGAASVGGSVGSLDVRRVQCRNLSSGETVSFEPPGADWDCEGAGLAVSAGDRIEQTVRSEVVDGADGSIIGLAGQRALCGNETTGQRVSLSLTSSNAWDCVAAGLAVSPGDRARVVLTGEAL